MNWQLPQGVEYPIWVRSFIIPNNWMPYHMAICECNIHNEKELNQLVESKLATEAHSIRINNSIDLVKVEK